MSVKITERGWPGHFICANRCRFRRNTLLEYNDTKIVVSTVGLMEHNEGYKTISFEKVGTDRYFETKAFHANIKDTRYYDIDVSRSVEFSSPWYINKIDADDEANKMHDTVVSEIMEMMISDKYIREVDNDHNN